MNSIQLLILILFIGIMIVVVGPNNIFKIVGIIAVFLIIFVLANNYNPNRITQIN